MGCRGCPPPRLETSAIGSVHATVFPPHTTRLEAYIYGHDATANMWWWWRRWKKRLVCVVIEKRGMPQNTGSGRLVNIYTSKYCATV